MAVRDIRCPECGEGRAVEKVDLGRYRCSACGQVFTEQELRLS